MSDKENNAQTEPSLSQAAKQVRELSYGIQKHCPTYGAGVIALQELQGGDHEVNVPGGNSMSQGGAIRLEAIGASGSALKELADIAEATLEDVTSPKAGLEAAHKLCRGAGYLDK